MAMVKTKYRYSIGDDSYDDAYDLYAYDWDGIVIHENYYDLTSIRDLEQLVEDCAREFYHDHDGWEHKYWTDGYEPLTFNIWINKSESVKCEVYCEFEPRFSAVVKGESLKDDRYEL